VRGDRFEALYLLAITTGMRQGELLGLQWPDIDLDAGKLTIFRSLHRTKRRRDPGDDTPWFQLRHPKTAGSRRSLEIPPVTVKALRDHAVRQRQARMLADSSWQEPKLIFTTRVGTPVDTTNVLHVFQKTLSAAGLPKMRFYDLRHTHASLLIAEECTRRKSRSDSDTPPSNSPWIFTAIYSKDPIRSPWTECKKCSVRAMRRLRAPRRRLCPFSAARKKA